MLKEVIERNINNNYNVASLETGISELILKEFLKGNAKLTIYDTENILKVLNIKIDNTEGKKIDMRLINCERTHYLRWHNKRFEENNNLSNETLNAAEDSEKYIHS